MKKCVFLCTQLFWGHFLRKTLFRGVKNEGVPPKKCDIIDFFGVFGGQRRVGTQTRVAKLDP